MSGVRKDMVCVECLMRVRAPIHQAQKHGWRVWVGGAKCKRCVEKESE